jgi:GNAT superfamily N-acetyltransferase
MSLLFRREDPLSPLARTLVSELWTDLVERYADDGGQPFRQEELVGPRCCFLVVYLDDAPVGCGGLRELDDETGEVKRMYVRVAARGRGLGRKLLEELEHRARGLGYRRLKLETGIPQPEAIRLYQTAGYGLIPGYGTYKDDPRTLSFEKSLD